MGRTTTSLQPHHPVAAPAVHQMAGAAPLPVTATTGGNPAAAASGLLVMQSSATTATPAGQVQHQLGGSTSVAGGVMIINNNNNSSTNNKNGTGVLSNGTDQDPEGNLANTKEKTPMCLINELARYNKVNLCLFSYCNSFGSS